MNPELHPSMKFVRMAVIETDKIHQNPDNPRPPFHLGAENPDIKALQDSLKASGQHQEIRVYELVPERPDEYMIVQGHRRHYAAQLINHPTLRCLVIERPNSKAEELDWLGSEDALKSKWGRFASMQHARRLAAEYRIPITSADIQAKTGIKKSELVVADKMFKLEPGIWAHVKYWEEIQYSYDVPDYELNKDHANDNGILAKGFAPEKAAIVWDLFEAFRNNLVTSLVRDLDDFELQRLIAVKASRSNIKECQRIKLQLDAIPRLPNGLPAGVMAELLSILDGKLENLAEVSKNTNSQYLTRVVNAEGTLMKAVNTLQSLNKNIGQTGSDIQALKNLNMALLQLKIEVDDFKPLLAKKITKLERAAAE